MDAKHHVERLIREAFSGVERGKVTLHQAEVMDKYGSSEDEARARELDKDVCWEQIPDQAIMECPDALAYLDPVSWRYYLPAHMLWVLRFGESECSNIAAHLTWDLFGGAKLDDDATRKFDVLSALQRRAVCVFLRHLSHQVWCEDDAALALQVYWGDHCPQECIDCPPS